jgi:hypothetical protein
MMDVNRKNLLEARQQVLDARRVDVAGAAARLQQEERVGVERGGIEIVGIRFGQLAHRLRVGTILLDPLLRIELLDVADRQRIDVRPLLRRGARAQRQRLLERRIGAGRFLRRHRAVQVRAPRPRFAPVTDGALGVPLPRFAKRPDGLRLRERVHQLKALIEERLRLAVGR